MANYHEVEDEINKEMITSPSPRREPFFLTLEQIKSESGPRVFTSSISKLRKGYAKDLRILSQAQLRTFGRYIKTFYKSSSILLTFVIGLSRLLFSNPSRRPPLSWRMLPTRRWRFVSSPPLLISPSRRMTSWQFEEFWCKMTHFICWMPGLSSPMMPWVFWTKSRRKIKIMSHSSKP